MWPEQRSQQARHVGIAGLVAGFLTVLACEAPIVLGLLGLGGGAGAFVTSLVEHPMAETFGLVASIGGAGLLSLSVINSRIQGRR